MLRKTMLLVLAVAMILLFSALPSFAGSSITSAEFVIGMSQYFVNDVVPGTSMDVAPYIDANSGRTLVPVRYLADALGATTNWDAGSQTITVTGGGTTISMAIGSTALTVNGQAQTLDQAPVIQNGRTYLPARWVAQALGYVVNWDAVNQIVVIWPNGTSEPGWSNVTGQVNLKQTTDNGFTIPTGTKLGIDTAGVSSNVPITFVIDTSKGDVQGQVADAQNILSQAQYLDSATISKAMLVINYDLTVPQSKASPQNPFPEQGDFNSPNGGSIVISAMTQNNQGMWIGVQIRSS